MGLLDFLGQLTQAGLNNRAQNRQNDFNASQADLNRQFQAQEAQIARDWQEQQYNLYSSPQAMVRQYQDAGLNPALMYGQNLQSSTGSSPMPSGSSASGSALGVSGATGNIVNSIISLAKLKQDIAESKSRENANNASAFASERAGLASNSASAKNYSDIKIGKQQIRESKHRIYKMIAETDSLKLKQQAQALEPLLTREEIKLKRGQQLNLSYQNFKEQYIYSFYERNSFYPEDSVIRSAWSVLDGIVQNIQFYGGKIVNFGKSLIPSYDSK